MREKLERLVAVGTEAVHIGVCARMGGARCPTMEENARWLEERGIKVVWKTHEDHSPKRK